jgi:Domain of unknown function (DUF4386)
MSTLTAPAPTAVRDHRAPWRWLIAVALPIGPLLVTITRGIMPYWTTDDTQTMVAKSLAHPGAMQAMAWLSLFMLPPLVIAMLALGYLARRGSPVLATIGAAISFVAYVDWGTAGNSDLMALAAGQQGFDQETITRFIDATANHPVASVASFGWVIGHILGMVLLGIALLRARAVPKWVAVALMVSQPMHLVAAVIIPSRLLDVTLGWGLTTVAFTTVAVVITRTR